MSEDVPVQMATGSGGRQGTSKDIRVASRLHAGRWNELGYLVHRTRLAWIVLCHAFELARLFRSAKLFMPPPLRPK
jgi:hypothetical protein